MVEPWLDIKIVVLNCIGTIWADRKPKYFYLGFFLQKKCAYGEVEIPSTISNLVVKHFIADNTAFFKCGNVSQCIFLFASIVAPFGAFVKERRYPMQFLGIDFSIPYLIIASCYAIIFAVYLKLSFVH